ncbi:MAG: sporulation protein YqfD [Brockia lithotrophica]|nr:sporulation protein YqfD [Brockia lithotrophica]
MPKFVRGYVRVHWFPRAGHPPAEGLSRLAAHGVAVRDVVYAASDRVEFTVRVEDVRTLRNVLRGAGKVRFGERRGLYAWLRSLRAHPGGIAGFTAFLLLLWVWSGFIWVVRVETEGAYVPPASETGGDRPSARGFDSRLAAAVREDLGRLGVRPGTWKGNLPPPEAISAHLRELHPELGWVGFSVDGVVARVVVVPKIGDPTPPPGVPQHLVAAKRAVVVGYELAAGKLRVRPGDSVEPGEILISGVLGQEGGETKLVPARGRVFGEVWYEVEVSVPREQRELVLGARSQRFLSLFAGNTRKEIFHRGASLSGEWTESTRRYALPLPWPLGIEVGERRELVPAVRTLSAEEAEELAKDLARREVLAQAHEGRVARALVLHREVGHDKVTLRLHIATVENIARPEPVSGRGDGPEAQPGA